MHGFETTVIAMAMAMDGNATIARHQSYRAMLQICIYIAATPLPIFDA